MQECLYIFSGEGSWESYASWAEDGTAVVVVAGCAELSVDGVPLPVAAGQAVVLTGAPSSSLSFEGEGIVFADPELTALGVLLQVPLALDPLSLDLVRTVFMASPCSPDHQRAALRLLCYQLLAALPVDRAMPPTGELGGMMTWIDQHLDEPLTVGTLAAQFGCSRTTVLNRFRDQVGNSPMAVVAEKRVQRARCALEQTDRTVTDIARSVGYPDLPSFTRFMKLRTGHAPTEIRRRAQWVI